MTDHADLIEALKAHADLIEALKAERQQAQQEAEQALGRIEEWQREASRLRVERQQAIDALRMAKPYIARYGSVEEFDLLANAIGEQP